MVIRLYRPGSNQYQPVLKLVMPFIFMKSHTILDLCPSPRCNSETTRAAETNRFIRILEPNSENRAPFVSLDLTKLKYRHFNG